MAIIFHILKYKFLSFVKINTTFDTSMLIKNAGSFIVYSAFAIGAFFFSYSMVEYLLEIMKIGLFLLHEFFSITLFIFFIAINVGNIIVSYSTLYKSNEVNYLFTKPISPSSIFVIKFLDNFFYSSSTLILILLSVLGGYAYYLDLSIMDVIIIFLFNFIPFMLSAAALGIIVLLIIVKLSTVIGPRLVIFTLIGLYIISVVIFFGIISPVDLVNKVMEYYPNVDMYFGKMLPAELHYLPNHWLSESLYWIARDSYTVAGKFFYLQIVTSIALLTIAMITGMKWYHKTWFYEIKLRSKNVKADLNRFFSFKNRSKLSGKFEIIFKREYHLFFREPTQVFHFAVLVILISVFLSSVGSLVKLGGLNIFLQTVIYLSVFIFNTFMIATLSLRFIFPLMSLEGKTFWKIKSAPISTMQFLRIKIAPYLIIILLISTVITIFLNRFFSFELMLIMLFVNAVVTISLASINFSLGALFVNFNERNPIRIASSQGASLSFLLNLIYMVILIILFYMPINFYFDGWIRSGNADYEYIIIACFLLLIMMMIILTISHFIFRKSLAKDF